MIRDQWYVILSSKEIKNKPIGIKRLNEKLVLWRNEDGILNCIQDACIHRGASLCKGEIKNNHIMCPFHGFEFDGEGKCKLIPSNGKNGAIPENYKTTSYKVVEKYGFVWLYYGDPNHIKNEIQFYDELNDFSYGEQIIPWKTHYSRAIENQLDVIHIPFLHKTTIGRGNKTLVNGPLVITDDLTITVYTNNVVDEGQIPKKEKELTDLKGREQRLVFKFPNTWQNVITDKMSAVIAFVPVDSENTLMYVRFYQNFNKVFGISHLINRLGSMANYVVQNQDKATVETQEPKVTSLRMNEFLVPGDRPILEYRKQRERLQKESMNIIE